MSLQFSVVTPTFQRAHTLSRVYESLVGQTGASFEWIVIDDGSTDDTASLVATWMAAAPFPVHYLHQANQGKPAAYAAGVARAHGEFTTVLDSDDWLEPTALSRLLALWDEIPVASRSTYSGITVLAADQDGLLLGTPFPEARLDSTFPMMLARGALVGDKWGFHRTEVLRAFPYPSFPGERFVPEGVVWNRITRHYRMRFVNEVLLRKEYQADGLMSRILDIRLRSPRGAHLYYREMLDDQLPWPYRVRTAANAARFGLAAGLSLPEAVGGFRHDVAARVPGALLGGCLHLRQRGRA
jgi:glycosyltransferase involved in cell wall biosynthesis